MGLPHGLSTFLPFLSSIPILPMGMKTSRKKVKKRHFFLFFARYWKNPRKLGTTELLKNVRLLRRYAPRNDKRTIFMSLRAIRRIARQSQALLWDFFNSPTTIY
jgi:hypothetical protein